MTVSVQTVRQQLSATGVIAVNIPVMATSDFRVVDVDDATGLETAVPVGEYTITLTTPASLPSLASINITTLVGAGATRWIYRETADVQDVDYFAEGAFDSQAHERAIDKRTLLSIETRAKAGTLSLRVPISEPRTAPMILPTAATRASKVMAFDSGGEPTAIVAVPAGSVAFTPDGKSLVEAADFAAMRGLLDLEPGVDYQPADADLTAIAALAHTPGYVIQSSGGVWVAAAIGAQQMPRGHLWGLEMVRSAAQSIQIQVGECRDAANTQNMTRSTTITKVLGVGAANAPWVVGDGNGGNGDALANAWYHVFLIRSGAGVIDAGFDRSPTAANLLALSTYTQYRRLGSVFHDTGSNTIRLFVQSGDSFLWDTPPLDIDDTNPGTGGVTRAISVPPDVKVIADQRWNVWEGGVDLHILVSSLDQADQAVPNQWANPPPMPIADSSHDWGRNIGLNRTWTRTNTLRQIRYRLWASLGGTIIRSSTVGWMDSRGRVN